MYRLIEGVVTAIRDSGSFKLDSVFRLHMQRIAFSYKKDELLSNTEVKSEYVFKEILLSR